MRVMKLRIYIPKEEDRAILSAALVEAGYYTVVLEDKEGPGDRRYRKYIEVAIPATDITGGEI